MSEESKSKETLADFLGLERLEISQGHMYRSIVEFALMRQYGTPYQI